MVDEEGPGTSDACMKLSVRGEGVVATVGKVEKGESTSSLDVVDVHPRTEPDEGAEDMVS